MCGFRLVNPSDHGKPRLMPSTSLSSVFKCNLAITCHSIQDDRPDYEQTQHRASHTHLPKLTIWVVFKIISQNHRIALDDGIILQETPIIYILERKKQVFPPSLSDSYMYIL